MTPETPWALQLPFPLFSALILLPLLGMGMALFVHGQRPAYTLGLIVASLELALTLWGLHHLNGSLPDLQFVERQPLFGPVVWHMGMDGLNAIFLPLTALLTLVVVLYAQPDDGEAPGVFVATVFASEAALMGMFSSLNLLSFWLFAVAELVPASFLILRWGTGQERSHAARHFLQFVGGGLLLFGAGMALLGGHHADVSGGALSFDLRALLETPLANADQDLVFFLLFCGLAVRMPVFPFHGWLPPAAQQGTVVVGSVFLAGAKVGAYGLLRFVFPLVPLAVQRWDSGLVALGALGMLYGGLLALVQINLRRLLAFAVVSQMGAVLVGLFSLNRSGLAGGLLLALSLGVATAGLFVVTGCLYRRVHTSVLPRLGGLFDAVPLLGLTFLVVALCSIAMPGTAGFEAGHLVVEGAIEAHGYTAAVIAAAGNVLAAGYLLWAYQRIFLAPSASGERTGLRDLSLREGLISGVLCAVIFGGGLFGRPGEEAVFVAVEHLLHSAFPASGEGR